MRGPIVWFGGKGNMLQKILPLFPSHHIYVEPFGGGASLLFAKHPSPVAVYTDMDEGLVCLFRVLRDPDQFARLHHHVSLTPYSRAEWKECKETWDACTDPVERAYRWFVVARQSFSGDFAASWGSVVTASSRGMAETCSNWLSTIENLPAIHARLMCVQIEQADWRVILDRYDTPLTLFYCDPPYVPATRKDGEYAHELSLMDHHELVTLLLGLKGMAILSGYPSPVYEPLTDAGWQVHSFQTACSATARTRNTNLLGEGSLLIHQPRTECLWISPRAIKQPLLQRTLKDMVEG